MRRRIKHSILVATLVATVAAGGLPAAFAQTAGERNALLAKAQSDSIIRIIARLKTAYTPETQLAGDAVIAQRAAIVTFAKELASSLAVKAPVDTLEGLPLAVLELDRSELERLLDSELVEAVVEDTLAEPLLAQSVPLINAPKSWQAGVSGAGQVVAILDTGVEASHPFLSGKVVSQACYSTTSSANGGSTSLCPNGQAQQTGSNAGRDCATSIRGCGHGTHVAGIAAGRGSSFSGVARDANIIAIQVFSRFNSAATCSPRPAPCALSYTSDQIRGLERIKALAGSFSIASVNMSLGGGKFASACDSDPRKTVIDQLRALKIATVVASGNDGFSDGISAPACISSAVSVGSTTKTDSVSGFSNSAAILDLLAPGSSINSSVVGGGFGLNDGTSMATPHVAGAFAVERSASPGDSVATILARLKANGKPVTGKGVTKPRIDLDRAAPPVTGAPLAFGTLWFNGSKQSGTSNWTSTFNSTYTRYEVTITGHSYHYLRYATNVTPAGDVRFCRTDSVSGKLLIYCYDKDGNPATSRIAFATYKQ